MLSKKNQEILDNLIQLHREGKLHGEFENIPNEVYHHPDCPGISSSNFEHINQSYDHYLQALEDARQERKDLGFRDKFFLGNAIHMASLEPELYEATFAIRPIEPKVDKRTTAGKALFAEWMQTVFTPWEAQNQGKTAIPEEIHAIASNCKKALYSHEMATTIMRGAKFEVSYWWQDPVTKITCKFRADVINKDLKIIMDLKSIGTYASASAWRKAIVSFNYDRSMAFYLEGVTQLFGDGWRFCWAVLEKRPPFGVQLFQPDQAMLEVGQKMFRYPLNKIARVHQSLETRGYSKEITVIGLPGYGFDVDSRTGE